MGGVGRWCRPGQPDSFCEEYGENANKVEVGCVTGDFAMQNVMISMGLVVLNPQGLRIRRIKHWVLRCFACFTSVSSSLPLVP